MYSFFAVLQTCFDVLICMQIKSGQYLPLCERVLFDMLKSCTFQALKYGIYMQPWHAYAD